MKKVRAEGFALIAVLGVLLATAVLVGMLMGISVGRAREARTDTERLLLENAAESGIHMMLSGLPVELMRDGQAHASWVIDGRRVEVWVQLSDGLVNLRLPSPLRDRLLARIFGRQADVMRREIGRLVAENKLVSVSQLAALPGVEASLLRQLLEQTSAFSEHDTPDPNHAPPVLRDLLPASRKVAAEPSETSSPNAIGKVVQLRAQASAEGRSSRLLMVEARLTGQLPQPVWVYDWLWLDARGPG